MSLEIRRKGAGAPVRYQQQAGGLADDGGVIVAQPEAAHHGGLVVSGGGDGPAVADDSFWTPAEGEFGLLEVGQRQQRAHTTRTAK